MCKLVCLLVGTPAKMIRDARGKTWWFEDHPFMGPCPVTPKTHEPLKGGIADCLPDDSPFWEAVQCWYDQGKRITEDGTLLWQKKNDPILNHLGGRSYEVIGERSYDDSGKQTVVMFPKARREAKKRKDRR